MSLGELSRALGLGEDAAQITRPLVALYQALDHELTVAAAGAELPCHPGCDACCHEAVFISAPEFLLVAEALVKARSRAQLEALIAEMSALAEHFSDELELLETIPAGDERDEVAARIHFRCPLLGGDGRCTVYEVRELNARTFGQAWDGSRGQAYGCGLTHARLRVIPERGPQLYDARSARRRLVAAVPGTELVQVYPWWFARYGALLLAAKSSSSALT